MAERLASCKLPRGLVHYRSDAEVWLRASGYFDGDASWTSLALDLPGREVLHSTVSRENSVIKAGPRGTTVFEKRSRALTMSDLQKVFRRAHRFTSPLLHEWTMLWEAREHGVRVPEPVAAGMHRGIGVPRSDFLLTELMPGRCLFSLLEGDGLDMPREQQLGLTACIARAVAGLHGAGIAFPDLYAKHVWVERVGEHGWDVGFLDLTSAYKRRRISQAERARDLGALAGSLPFKIPIPLVVRFLRTYLEHEAGWELRVAWREISDRAVNLQRLRRFRRSLTSRAGFEFPKLGSHEEIVKATLLKRFEVPTVEGRNAPVPLRDDLLEPLKRLVLATFQAGVLPMGDVLPHLRSRDDGELAWDVRAPLRAPRKSRAIHARWRVLFLQREIARSALSRPVRISLIRWLRSEPIAAFGLTRL